eukprot:5913906-Pyramimonas_sp.AAC.1
MWAVALGLGLSMGPRSGVLGGRTCQTGCFGAHADGSTGAVGGAPYGATKRCTGWVNMQNCFFGAHAGGGTGDSGGAP